MRNTMLKIGGVLLLLLVCGSVKASDSDSLKLYNIVIAFDKVIEEHNYEKYALYKKAFIEQVQNYDVINEAYLDKVLVAARYFRDPHFTKIIFDLYPQNEKNICTKNCKHHHHHNHHHN